VRRGDGGLRIVDAGSLNGVWVNGRRVNKANVSPADAVMIGSTLLRFALQPDGSLEVVRRDCGDQIALEAVSLTREVGGGFRGENKRILDRVHLTIRPGEFVGLLGPSGAGKSTLLKAMNGYTPPSHGCVLLNEMPLYPCFDMFRSTIGYVPQDDIVHPELSVEASLDYVSRLRLPGDVSEEQRRDLIASTIETLGLSHVAKTQVQNLSGGQRKRVSIGCELITRPSLLFLDEPTSGMDPSTEERLMRHFQGMARRGTTVLITTHILYNLGLLDRLVILSRGRLVFFGTPSEAMQFFAVDGEAVARPTQIFDILEGQAGSAPSDPDQTAEEYQQKYLNSPLFRENVAAASSTIAAELRSVSGDAPAEAQQPPAPAEEPRLREWVEKPEAGGGGRTKWDIVSPSALATLTRRNLATKLVSYRRLLFYLAAPVVLALVTLSLRAPALPTEELMAERRAEIAAQLNTGYVDLGEPVKALLSPQGADDPRPPVDVVHALKYEGAANLPAPLSVLLMFTMTAVFLGTLMACLELSTERPIYVRERMANQRIADYILSKLPFLMAATAVQCAVFIALCWLKPELRIMNEGGVLLAMIGMAWAAACMGLFISAVDPTPGRFSVILAIVIVLPQLVLSGGLGPDFYGGMPAFMKWLSNALPARWGLETLMTAFYRQPDNAALSWAAGFVQETVGFRFGADLYWTNTAILAVQAIVWLGLCAAALKRLDKGT
jgi:ABC-type multidrug transport system ATPase subunit